MLPWNSDKSQRTIHSILELYQICRRNGDWANIYSEIRISHSLLLPPWREGQAHSLLLPAWRQGHSLLLPPWRQVHSLLLSGRNMFDLVWTEHV